MFRKLFLALALVMVLPTGAYALGLGGITLKSRLNQPLLADIQLRDVQPGDLDKLRVGLGNQHEFDQAGLDRPFLLARLKFKAIDEGGGRAVIQVTTHDPFREPFVSFLVSVEWPNGKLLREYTLLLDPPLVTGRKPAPIQAPTAQPAAAPAAAPMPRSGVAAPTTGALPAAGPGQYRVQRGDNLYTIARTRLSNPSVTVDQAMIALLRANPDAFIAQNVNQLKEGYVLRIPAIDQVRAIKQAQALAAVRRQTADWRAKHGLAGRTTGQSGGAGAPAVATAPHARLQVISPSAKAKEPGTAGGTAEGKGPVSQQQLASVQNDLALAKEATAAQKLENEDLRGQVSDLEKKLADVQHLVTLKVQELAALQARLQQAGVKTPPAPASTAPQPSSETKAATTTSPAGATKPAQAPVAATNPAQAPVAAAKATPPPTAEAKTTEAPMTAAPGAAQQAQAPAPASAKAVAPAQQGQPAGQQGTKPAAQPQGNAKLALAQPQPLPKAPVQAAVETPKADPLAFLTNLFSGGIFDNPIALGGVGGGIILLLLLLMLMIRRRQADEADEAADATLFAVAGGGAVDEALSEPEPEEAAAEEVPEDELGAAEQHPEPVVVGEAEGGSPVDQMLAEADVYLAYGRYQQAQDLVSGALEDHPDRLDLKTKLLEVYFATRDRNGFEALADEVHDAVKAEGGAEWDKLQLMGRDLCPDNPLFAEGTSGGEFRAEDSSLPSGAFDTGISFDPFAEEPAPAAPSQSPETGSEPQVDEGLDFNLDLDSGTGLEEAAEAAEEAPEDATHAADFTFDFGKDVSGATEDEESQVLEYEPPAGTGDEQTGEAAEPDIDLAGAEQAEGAEDLGLDFDFGTEAAEGSEGAETDTPLDLELHTIQTNTQEVDALLEAGAEQAAEQEGAEQSQEQAVEPAAPQEPSLVEDQDFSIEWDITGMGVETPEEESEAESAQQEEPAEPPEEQLSEPEEDLESTTVLDFREVPLEEDEVDADADMVATKLDLAKAYIDMGDADGARNILDEVSKEGSDTQKQEAEELMKQLG